MNGQNARFNNWSVNSRVFDHYVVESILGEGGMGIVYLLRDTDTGMPYAVKRAKQSSPEARDLFLAELQTWIGLPPHSNLASCRFYRTLEEETIIFSDYHDGGSLSAWIANGKVTSLSEALDIAIQFALGLNAAHLANLVHQDVKPANVLMSDEGVAKVSDFGLSRAKVANGDTAASTGALTRQYASPEQIAGRSLTKQTDIWSWGVSLMEILLGEVVWLSGDAAPATLEDILIEAKDNAELAKQFTPKIAGVLRKCFAPIPSQRWASMEEAAFRLIEIYQEETCAKYPRTITNIFASEPNRHSVSDSSDVEQLIEDIFVAAGRTHYEIDLNKYVAELKQTTSDKGRLIAEIRLLKKVLDWLDAPEWEASQQVRLFLRARCLSAKARRYFDGHDYESCYHDIEDAITVLTVKNIKECGEEHLWLLAEAYQDKAFYLHNSGHKERSPEPAKVAVHFSTLGHEQFQRKRKWVGLRCATLTNLANAYRINSSTFEEALKCYELAINIRNSEPSTAQNTNSIAINLQNMGLALCDMGHMEEGINALRRALIIREDLCRGETRIEFLEDLGISLYNLASQLLLAKQNDEATVLITRAIEVRQEIVSQGGGIDGKVQLANALSLRANCLAAGNRSGLGVEVAVDALLGLLLLRVESGRKDINSNINVTVNTLSMIIRKLCKNNQKNDVALVDALERLLADRNTAHFVGISDFSGFLNDYSLALVRLERFDEARVSFNKLLAFDRQTHGDKSREVGMTLHNRGLCELYANNLGKADSYFSEAADLFSEHESLAAYKADAISMRAEIVMKQERPGIAIRMFDDANALFRSVLQPDENLRQHQMERLKSMAKALEQCGRVEEAKEALGEAYSISVDLVGENDLQSGAVADALGLLLARAKQYDLAVPWFRISLISAMEQYGDEGTVVRAIRQDFGRLLIHAGAQASQSGCLKTAVTFFLEAAEIGRMLPDKVMQATALTNLGVNLRRLGRNQEALEALATALEMSIDVFGAESTRTLMCQNSYAIGLAVLGRYQEAIQCCQQGLAIAQRDFGIKSELAEIFEENIERFADNFKEAHARNPNQPIL